MGATNAAGWSPLHHAAQIGAAGLLSEELLAAGADPHARTEVRPTHVVIRLELRYN